MNTTKLDVRFVASENEVPSELWEKCFPPPLEGRWWYQTLETCGLEDQFEFSYAVLFAGERPVGVAPVFLTHVPMNIALPPSLRPLTRLLEKLLPSLLNPLTLFVGSPCSDEGTVGILPPIDRRQALLELQTALQRESARRRASVIIWNGFPEQFDADLEWLARERGLFRMTSYPGSIVDFTSNKKEDYFKNLKGSRRYNVKKKLRRSRDVVNLTVSVSSEPDTKTIDEIFGLFWQTYERSETKFEVLDKRFFEVIAKHPQSHFITLREQDSNEMVAFMLCFELGDHIINKYIGFDYQRPRDWLLYFRLWDAAVDWALSRGASSIQSGYTAYRAKIEVGHRLYPLTVYGLHRNRLLHAIYGAVARRIRWRTLDDDLAILFKAHPELERF